MLRSFKTVVTHGAVALVVVVLRLSPFCPAVNSLSPAIPVVVGAFITAPTVPTLVFLFSTGDGFRGLHPFSCSIAGGILARLLLEHC